MLEKPLGRKYFLEIPSSQWKVSLATKFFHEEFLPRKFPHGGFLLRNIPPSQKKISQVILNLRKISPGNFSGTYVDVKLNQEGESKINIVEEPWKISPCKISPYKFIPGGFFVHGKFSPCSPSTKNVCFLPNNKYYM